MSGTVKPHQPVPGGGGGLAIVIPAYKGEYLDATLASVAEQTSNAFRVYVGDDASPHDLAAICGRWASRLDIVYHRFQTNLGGTDLVGQWDRCVALSSEPWVWLFGDDDLMEPRCVQVLLAVLDRYGSANDVFHFDVRRIDDGGAVILDEPAFPDLVSARAFAAGRLQFRLSSYAPDYVFSRRAYQRVGGFPRFPLAWCSDDAGWIAMAGAAGIRAVRGPKVRWRLSGLNLSSRQVGLQRRKLQALLAYLVWLRAQLRSCPAASGEPSDNDVLQHSARWLYRQADLMGLKFWPADALRVAWTLRSLPEHGLWRDLWRTARADLGRLWL